MHRVSEIKLIRTDTTLDLSQKAEKVWARRDVLAAQVQVKLTARKDCGLPQAKNYPSHCVWSQLKIIRVIVHWLSMQRLLLIDVGWMRLGGATEPLDRNLKK